MARFGPIFGKASLGAIALTLGGLATSPAHAADRVAAAGAKAAERATRALQKREIDKAVAAAEQAVTLSPQLARYRLLLGQTYLQAGRFRSAEQAFGDTLALDAGDGRAALNLALTRIARGDHAGARAILDAHVDGIPAVDRGLALALTGDADSAVTLLTSVARSPATSPKARQNLALAYALAGQWGIARVVAAADISPADVDARLEQWAAFAQPRGPADQVAELLGVQPVADDGQPAALALNAAPAAVAAAPTAPPAPAPAPVLATIAAPAPLTAAVPVAAMPARPIVTFGPRKEVVQAITPAMIAGRSRRWGTEAIAAVKPAPGRGRWYVRLGAFQDAAVARDGWTRARRRYAALNAFAPRRASVRSAGATYQVLAVGGFTRSAANRLCAGFRARGGACSIKAYEGEQLKAWLRQDDPQVAMK